MNGFSKQKIGEALNNIVAMSLSPASLAKPLTEGRIRNLRDYTKALVQPALDECDEGNLKPEELVYLLSCAALWIQASRILKSDKLPMAQAVDKIFNKKVELPNIEVKCPKCKNRFEI